MKITVEFDTWEEMEIFRTSGKKARGKKEEPEVTVEEVTEKVAQMNSDMAAPQFTPPPVGVVAQPHAGGFPGSNSGTMPAVATPHPLVAAILARIDGAVASGQPADAIVTWFRQQIGPDAAQASLDQIKQVFIPRMGEAQLKQIAPQLGITA